MGRREIFSGNWKMYKTYSEAEELVRALLAGLGDIGDREVVIFPPSPYVRELVKLCANSPVKVGMQNMYFEDEGAFTGEVSPVMVKDAGSAYILIGHSERRHIFGEKDEDVNRKVKAAFKYGIMPFICVGELIEEREKNLTEDVVKRQIKGALKDITPDQMEKIVIAYEPVWAIGTGKVATPEIADKVHRYIRMIIRDLYSEAIAGKVPVLYGGSVKPDNIQGLYKMENIDGVLVGGASLKADSFLEIIHVH